MENRIRILKIIHLCLAVLSIIMIAVRIIASIFHPENGFDGLGLLLDLTRELTLFLSSVYLVFGYKKEAASFYQAADISMILTLFLRFFAGESVLQSIFSIFSLIALLILSFHKNLGRKRTSYVYALLFVSEVLMTFTYFAKDPVAALATLIILGSLGIMITGKYADKDARGSR